MTPKELYEQIGGDYDAAVRTLMNDMLISRFIVKVLDDKSFENLMNAAEAFDPNGLFEASHAMKGVYANLGLMNLSNAASEITEEFRPGAVRKLSDDEVRQKIAALKTMYETAVDGIRRFAQEE